jgi:hypothetical protein
MSYTDEDLIYASTLRCPCGAGMAYVRGAKPGDYWDCSAILKGEAIPSGQPGSVTHEARLPFVFYKVKSEEQPSAQGMTTRPCDHQPVSRDLTPEGWRCSMCGQIVEPSR